MAVAGLRCRLRSGELSQAQFEAESLAVQRRVTASAEAAAEAGVQCGGDWIAAETALLAAWPDMPQHSPTADGRQQSAAGEGEDEEEGTEEGEQGAGAGAGDASQYMLLPLGPEAQERVLRAWAIGERARLRVLDEEGHTQGVGEALAEVDEKLARWLSVVRASGQAAARAAEGQTEAAVSATHHPAMGLEQGTAAAAAGNIQDPEAQLPPEARAALSTAAARQQQATVAAAPTERRLRKSLASRLRNTLLRLRRQYDAQLLAYGQYLYECEAVRSQAQAAAQAAAEAMSSSNAGGLQAAQVAIKQAWPTQLTSTPPAWLSEAGQRAWEEAAKRRKARTRTLGTRARAGQISELQRGQATLESGRVFEAEVRQLLRRVPPLDTVVTPYSPLQHLWQPARSAPSPAAAAGKPEVTGPTAGQDVQTSGGPRARARRARVPASDGEAAGGAGAGKRAAGAAATVGGGAGMAGGRAGSTQRRVQRAGHAAPATGGAPEPALEAWAADGESAPCAIVMSTRRRHVVASPEMSAQPPRRGRKPKPKPEGVVGTGKVGVKGKAAATGIAASSGKPRGRPRKVPTASMVEVAAAPRQQVTAQAGTGVATRSGKAGTAGNGAERRAAKALASRSGTPPSPSSAPSPTQQLAAATAVGAAAAKMGPASVLSAEVMSGWHAESQRSWDAATAAAAQAWLLNSSSSSDRTGQLRQPLDTQEDRHDQHATSAADEDVGLAIAGYAQLAADADERVQAMLGIIATMEQQLARLQSAGVLPGQHQQQYDVRVAQYRAAIDAALLGIQRYVMKRDANIGD